jgi:Putative peptidoglycan binding domain
MRLVRDIIGWLLLLLLSACAASHPEERADMRSFGLAPGPERLASGRLLTRGNILIAEVRLKDFGFDPGPVDGTYTAETEAAVRAFQARYGLPVSGLLDRPTREELKLGVDPKRGD